MVEHAASMASSMRQMPKLANTDGEDLVMCTSRYEFKATERAAIEGIISGLHGLAGDEDDDEGRACFTWSRSGNGMHRDWDNTTLGRVLVGDGELRLETNSRERNERLRALVEKTVAGRLSFIETTTKDVMSEVRRPKVVKPERNEGSIPPEVERAIIGEFLEKHYASWADDPLPALKGKTPREAVKTTAGRKSVDELLREMEYRSARSSSMAGAYDFGKLRCELGLA
jgi:hypothetical protein